MSNTEELPTNLLNIFSNLFRQIDSKLNITSLTNIFREFKNSLGDKKINLTFKDSFDRFSVGFEYQDKMYTGTVTMENTIYYGKNYQIINVKLPVDELIFTSNSYEINFENREMNQFVFELCKFIEQFDNKEFYLNIWSKITQDTIEFYFADERKLKMITIKYKRGWYDYDNKNRTIFTKNEIFYSYI